MPNLTLADLQGEIQANVRTALAEDVGGGDLTAQLIDPQREAEARVITREHATIAGRAWVDEVFRQVDPRVLVTWQVEDGQRVEPNQMLFQLKGPARALLTGERSALNFLQLLSGTATRSQHYADLVAGTAVKLLDTRKTLPGLRLAQKYAVTCGGCHNHRIGLYDAFLIKENHIAACGGIDRAIAEARRIAPGKPVEVEVENLDELRQALEAGADIVMLDELSLDDMRTAVALTAGRAKLEASGGINEGTLRNIAETGVDYISIGTLTKDVRAAHPYGSTDGFTLTLYFGRTDIEPLQDLARQLFEAFPCPLLLVEFKRNRTWHIEGIKPGAIHKLREDQEDLFANALDSFSRQIWRKPRSRKPFRYDLAILHDPGEAFPPSDAKALKNFVRVGRSLGIDVDLIERKDYSRIAEYDALFIRETTNVADHTYRFAKKAESEGLVVMDDPVSILRCTNKVYLADLLRSHKLGMPATEILYKENPQELEKVGERLGFPLVLKIPDGSFSRGVIKVEDQEQLLAASAELFERSVLILAQEFFYTEYDWRIGVLNRKPIFACQYFMSKGHWQIYDHSPDAEEVSGDFRTMPVHEAPRKVVELAVKTANLIGDGLYGVDLKQAGDKVVVIEVNDNPNIDCGVEDVYLGDDLYKLVLEEFVRRLEVKRRGYD